MSRRFQFSLRALLAVMLAVAVACAIWIKLPTGARVAIVIAAVWVFLSLPELLLHHADLRRRPDR